jgi:hypothetical protein
LNPPPGCAALGSVAGKAGQKLGLDVVQVLQDRQGGQTMVAGKYVSPPLYLGFRQPIVPPSTTAGTTAQLEAVEFEVEYAALRQAQLTVYRNPDKIEELAKSFRRKLANVPLNLDYPYWVEDSDFDPGMIVGAGKRTGAMVPLRCGQKKGPPAIVLVKQACRR